MDENQVPAPAMPGGAPQPTYIPELHQFGPDGQPTHIGMVDPTSGQPMVIPADLHNQVFGGASGNWAPSAAAAPAPDVPREPAPPVNSLNPAPPPVQYGTTSTSDSVSHSVDPKFEKKAQESEQSAIDANIATNKAVEAHAAAVAAGHQAEAIELNRQIQQQQAQQAEFEAGLKQKDAEAKAAIEEYSNAKLDTNHYWANASTGTKVVSGIAMTLGAIGQALTGSKTNSVIDMIDDKIKQDIEAQKQNIDKLGVTANMKKGLVAQYMAEGKNKDEAAKLAYETSLRAVQKQYEVIADSTNSDVIKGQATKALAEWQTKTDEAAAARHGTEYINKSVTAPIIKGNQQSNIPPKLQQELDDYDAADKALEEAKAHTGSGGTGRGILQSIRTGFGGEGDPNRTALDSAEARATSKVVDLMNKRMQGTAEQKTALIDKMVPSGSDAQKVANNKIDNMQKMLREEKATLMRSLQNGKYNTSAMGTTGDVPGLEPKE